MDREIIADYTSWCSKDIKCGVILSDILNEIGDKRLVSKVNTHINRFTVRCKSLNSLDKVTRKYYLCLLLNDTKGSINEAPFPNNVKTFLLNLIRVKFRQEIDKI